MFKTEIRFDRSILEAEGYEYEHTMNLSCENFKRAWFIEELNEEAHLIFRGFKNGFEYVVDFIISAKRGNLW